MKRSLIKLTAAAAIVAGSAGPANAAHPWSPAIRSCRQIGVPAPGFWNQLAYKMMPCDHAHQF